VRRESDIASFENLCPTSKTKILVLEFDDDEDEDEFNISVKRALGNLLQTHCFLNIA